MAKKKNTGGRPTSFTPEIQRIIVEILAAGNYVDTAAKVAGIQRKTFYNWLDRGRAGEEPFVGFLHACEKAIAEAESSAVKSIQQAGKRNWQALAWWLERRHRGKWAKTSDLGQTPSPNTEPPKVTVTERPANEPPPSVSD